MTRIKLVLVSLFLAVSAYGQEQITLDSCIHAAYEKLAFKEQSGYINQGRTYAMEGNNHYNLPSFELNGSATIQNEQIAIAIPVPGFNAPEAPLNFNRLLINFNQTLYNGNLAAKKKLIDSLSYDEQQQGLEIEKLKIKSQVIGVYATLLVVQTNQAILIGHIKVLDKKYNQLKGAVEGGVATHSKLQILTAEKLSLKQRMTELTYNEYALLATLNNYTGLTINVTTKLIFPTPKLTSSNKIFRPELLLLDTKIEGLKAQSELANNGRLPYVGLFGSFGAGYPGYNIFDQSVRPMALGGVVIKWNLWDWNKTNNAKAQLVVGESILKQQRTRTEMAFERELIKQQSEVAKYQQLIVTDNEIIEAQKKVSQALSSELINGTATAFDYTSQLNTESSAKLKQELHKIQLMMAIITYNTIKGNGDEYE